MGVTVKCKSQSVCK